MISTNERVMLREIDNDTEEQTKGWICPLCRQAVSPKKDVCPSCSKENINEFSCEEGKQILNG